MAYIKPIVFTAFPHVGGLAGAFITRKNIKNWYENLNRPSWRPPNWLFGPVWTSLYTGMGYASYMIYRDGGGFDGEAKTALALYGSQLALNWAWTPIFFGCHKLGLATAEILVLAGNIGACIFYFSKINKTASYILIPYMAWVSFASVLTAWMWRNNPDPKKAIKEE